MLLLRVVPSSNWLTISSTISTGSAADIDGDRMFVRRRLLQRRKLAVEQRHRHEMLVPRGHAPVDEIVRAFEVDQRHVRRSPMMMSR